MRIIQYINTAIVCAMFGAMFALPLMLIVAIFDWVAKI